MGIQKNFVVKNGLEVADNLLLVENNKVGINTSNPEYSLDVNGSLGISSEFYVPRKDPLIKTTVGIVSDSNFGIISGIDTSSILLNDYISGNFIQNETQVVSIGNNAISINKNHTNTSGSSSENISFLRYRSSGEFGDFLLSQGEGKHPIWTSELDIEVSLAKTAFDVIGGIASVSQLYVSPGISTVQNIEVNGSLDVTGLSTLSGATEVNSTLDVTGATTLNSTLDVTGSSTLNSTLDVTGATTLDNTLNVTGATTLNSTLDVTGSSTLSGATEVNSTLGVTGATTLNSTLDVTGSSTLNNTSIIGFADDLLTVTQQGSGPALKVNNYEFSVKTGTINTSTGMTTAIDSYFISAIDYSMVEYTLNFINGNNIQAQKVLVVQNSEVAYCQEYGVIFNNSPIVSIGVSVVDSQYQLYAITEPNVSGITTYKFIRGGLE